MFATKYSCCRILRDNYVHKICRLLHRRKYKKLTMFGEKQPILVEFSQTIAKFRRILQEILDRPAEISLGRGLLSRMPYLICGVKALQQRRQYVSLAHIFVCGNTKHERRHRRSSTERRAASVLNARNAGRERLQIPIGARLSSPSERKAGIANERSGCW